MTRCLPALMVVLVTTFAVPAYGATMCGLLDGPGCVPTVCSVLDPRPCLGDEDFPFSGDLRVTIDSRSAADVPKPDHDLNTIRELFFMLRSCWAPPPEGEAQKDMQMSVRVSFKSSGAMFGGPQLTYVLPGTSDKVRASYRSAIAQSFAACAPLHFTQRFAGAIAGRPILIRYVDNRDLTQQ